MTGTELISDKGICSNPSCRVAEDGKCIDGFDLSECERFGHEIEEEPEENVLENSELPPVVEPLIDLPKAGTLSANEAVQFLCAGECRLMAIVGPHKAGKTSLIASLFDLFQRGPVAENKFSRSVSLHAFDRLCHDARSTSGRGEAEMERTKHGGVRFYQMEIFKDNRPVVLLLADRAGEDYTNAGNDISLAETFDEIKRADSITVLVDGEKLASGKDRANVVSMTRLQIQAIVDSNMAARKPLLIFALTKLDAVNASPHKERIEDTFTKLAQSCSEQFGENFSRVESVQIAASPKEAGVDRGSGLDILLSLWLMKMDDKAPLATEQTRNPSRAFSRIKVQVE